MLIIRCDECGWKFTDFVKICPICGIPLKKIKSKMDNPASKIANLLGDKFKGMGVVLLSLGTGLSLTELPDILCWCFALTGISLLLISWKRA